MTATVHHLDTARAWRAEFHAQGDSVHHAAAQLVDQLRIEGQHSTAAQAIEAANIALAALANLGRLSARVTGITRALD